MSRVLNALAARRSRPFRIGSGLTILAALTLGIGCAQGDDPAGPPDAETEVQLELTGMPEFAQSEAVFELWISFAITGRHAVAASAGRFKIDQPDSIVGLDYQPVTLAIDPEDPNVPVDGDGAVRWQLAVDAFITLEDRETPSDGPRLNGLIGGSFLNGIASLTIGYGDALNRDFSSAAGSAMMATPTTPATGDETEGIWFALEDGSGPSLTLPAPPPGWIYQGWVSIPQVGLRSLGKFSAVDAPDSDGAGPLAGSQPWSLPGSDFPFGEAGHDLSTGGAVVTLEPTLDEDGTGPFFLEILAGSIPNGQLPNDPFPLANVATFPTGSVRIPFAP